MISILAMYLKLYGSLSMMFTENGVGLLINCVNIISIFPQDKIRHNKQNEQLFIKNTIIKIDKR